MNKLLKQSTLCLFLTGELISCKSLTEPDFYRMSAAELNAYNSNVPGPEQVKCVKVIVAVDSAAKRICGTLQEIQHLSQPIAPGARIDNFFPRFPTDSRSRATNPSLRPTGQQPPL